MQSVFGNLLHSHSGGVLKHSETQQKRAKEWGKVAYKTMEITVLKWIKFVFCFISFIFFAMIELCRLNVGNQIVPKDTLLPFDHMVLLAGQNKH